MSDKLKESLSAVMDGEADEFELRRVLDEADSDPELRASWERYHLISAAIKGEAVSSGNQLRQRVRDALSSEIEQADVEPLQEVATEKPASPSWLGRVTGIAVAASVAFAVAISFNLDEGEDQLEISALSTQAGQVQVPTIQADVLRAAEFITDADMQRTQAYMVHHAQHTSLNNQAGVVPFVKFASYESQ